MADPAISRYSSFVALAKVALPLVALALLSTVFLLARGPQGSDTIPYAEIEELAAEPRVTDPRYAGVTENGSELTVTARSIRPEGEGGASVERIAARLTRSDGARVDVIATEGALDNAARTITLSGLAQITTSNGYMIETGGVVTDLETGQMVTDGPLEARTPEGRLTAGRLTIDPGGPSRATQLVFDGGVQLVYLPQKGD